jgi:hypothetical protein
VERLSLLIWQVALLVGLRQMEVEEDQISEESLCEDSIADEEWILDE